MSGLKAQALSITDLIVAIGDVALDAQDRAYVVGRLTRFIARKAKREADDIASVKQLGAEVCQLSNQLLETDRANQNLVKLLRANEEQLAQMRNSCSEAIARAQTAESLADQRQKKVDILSGVIIAHAIRDAELD